MTLTARLDPRTNAVIGSPVTLAVDLEHVYLFDPETELAIR